MKKDLQIAIQYHQTGNLISAEKIYRELLEKNPGEADIWHLLGILLAQEQKYPEAKQCIEKAVHLDPSNMSYENSLGNILKNIGELTQAKIHYQKALSLKPNYAVAEHNLGNIFYQEKNYTDAEKHYRKAIYIQPNYADAHYHLGNLLAKQEKIHEAIAAYEATIKIDPLHAAAHYHLAQLLQSQHQWDQALQHYQKCIEIDNRYASAHHNLATIYVKKASFPEAIEHFKKTLELDPEHPEAIYNLATTYLLINKLEEALQYFLQLLQFQKDADIYYNIGTIFMQMDRHRDAIIHLQEALKMRPEHLDTLLNLGAAYLKQEDYLHAIEIYHLAEKLKPNDPEINYILNALEQKGLSTAAPKEYLQHLFDQYAPYFEKHLKFLDYQVPQLLFTAVNEELSYTNKKNQLAILDLGCGTGLAGKMFRPIAKKLIGIDVSEKMIDVAKTKNIYDELQVLDIDAALVNYQHQDVILAADVFTYIGDLESIFKAVKQAMNLKGLFAFTVEKTEKYPYILQKSARYAHNKKYIEILAKENNFDIKQKKEVILRQQKGQPVEGYLFVLGSARNRDLDS